LNGIEGAPGAQIHTGQTGTTQIPSSMVDASMSSSKSSKDASSSDVGGEQVAWRGGKRELKNFSEGEVVYWVGGAANIKRNKTELTINKKPCHNYNKKTATNTSVYILWM